MIPTKIDHRPRPLGDTKENADVIVLGVEPGGGVGRRPCRLITPENRITLSQAWAAPVSLALHAKHRHPTIFGCCVNTLLPHPGLLRALALLGKIDQYQ